MGRWLRRLGAGIVVLVLVAVLGTAGLVVAVTVRPYAPTSGTLELPGLAADVTVVRDAAGIPQIVADTPRDLFVAQGWVHASERMWQMEVWRRIGAGRLAELFGPTQVATDRFIRTVGWRRAAERDLAALSPEAVEVLEAYAEGVNAYLASRPGGIGSAFVIAGLVSGLGEGLDGFVPEPWTPLDTLTWAKVQAWGLGGNMDAELFRALVDARLGDPARTDELFPAYDPAQPVIADEAPGAALVAAAPSGGTALAAADAAAWAELAAIGRAVTTIAGLTPERGLADDGGVGSNNWVVAPSNSATGTALLANDPHLGLNVPSVWFVNGLHCRTVSAACPWDVVGVSFPGTPAVIAGRNGYVAWGVTNANPDVQDLVEERLDPADPGRYLWLDGSEAFTTREETIEVAGGDPVVFTVRESRHGPILNDGDARLRESETLYALRWTAIAAPDTVVQSFLGLGTAASVDDVRAALRNWGAPAQNVVFATTDGHIGYQMPGHVPIRTLPEDRGLRPVPGWDGQHEWVGRVPFEALPFVLDPPSGRIVTANNAIATAGGVWLGDGWDRGDRAARILELLDAGPVDLDRMSAIQNDVQVLRADRLVPAIVDLKPIATTGDGQRVLDALRAWDGACGVGSTGCAAFMAFEFLLARAVFDDELGPQARDYTGSGSAQDLLARLAGTEEGRASAWWDDAATAGAETARDLVARTLDATGERLRTELGEPGRWTWGALHGLTLKEATLGSSGIAPLERYFGTDRLPVTGAAGAVNNTYWRTWRAYPNPADPSFVPVTRLADVFSVTNGPSMRALYDLGDPDAGRIITTTGQSGHPFSPHVLDWVDPWRFGETVPLPFSADAIAAAGTETLVLTPAP